MPFRFWKSKAAYGIGTEFSPAPVVNLENELRRAVEITCRDGAAYSYLKGSEVAVAEVENAFVTARRYHDDRTFVGAVYNGAGVLDPSTLRFNTGDIAPIDPRIIDPRRREGARFVEGEALYGGIIFPILGHFLFETLGRLWPIVERLKASNKPFEGRICFHPWPGFDLASFFARPFFRDVFKSLKVAPDQVLIATNDLIFERLMVPSAMSVYHESLDPKLAGITDWIAGSIIEDERPWRGSSRIFLSRGKWGDNPRIENEAALDLIFENLGFLVIHPQEMPTPALLSAIGTAQQIACTDGSHAHLAVFAKRGARILNLDTRVVPTQFAVEALRGLSALHIPLYESAFFNRTTRVLRIGPEFTELLACALDRGFDELDEARRRVGGDAFGGGK